MSTLPLPVRLRRAAIIALLLGLWAPFKIGWERQIDHQQNLLRYRDIAMTRQLRDQLGQGLSLGVLSGMGAVVADFLWLNVETAWEHQDWFKMGGYINLCTALQPRCVTFWDMGGWHLAWNVADFARLDPTLGSDLRRIKAYNFWVDKGRDIFQRGIENNPEHYKLWADMALLYQNRLADQQKRMGLTAQAAASYRKAGWYFEQSNKCPDAPIYQERFPAYMYQAAGDDQDAYRCWVDLWHRLTPQQLQEPQHAKGKIESSIRALENKLNIPQQKRIFPN